MQQISSYLGHTGRAAKVIVKAALDPKRQTLEIYCDSALTLILIDGLLQLVRHAQATSANLDVDLHRALLGAELVSRLADDSRLAACVAGNSLSGACLYPASLGFHPVPA